jgi:urease accessory protein
MQRAAKAGHYHLPVADTVVLDYEERRRRRGVVKAIGGREFLVDLHDSPILGPGDGYVLEDGAFIEIVAAPEELLEVRGKDPLHLTQLAYHLGNRHLECQISHKHIRIRRDHVIAEMLKGLGAKTIEVEAPFFPEGGAYAHGAHDHGHQDHGHKHGHDQHHDHTDGDEGGCGHDHGHNQAHSHKHDHKHEH